MNAPAEIFGSMASKPVWALIYQEAIPLFEPRACTLIPPPPHPLKRGEGPLMPTDGAAFGPMTYAEAQEFESALCAYNALAIVPSCGLQVISLAGLAYEKAAAALDHALPGMTFYPSFYSETGDNFVLVGYGEPFTEISTEDITASCLPTMAFPIGRPWATPVRNRRGDNRREELPWFPPNLSSLDDLAPLAKFLSNLNLTEQDQADFRAAQAVREAEDIRMMAETDAYWKAKAADLTDTRTLLP